MSHDNWLRAVEHDACEDTSGSAEMDVDELVRLTLTEADIVAQLIGGVARLQQVQRAKALLAQIEDPDELRGLLSRPAPEEGR